MNYNLKRLYELKGQFRKLEEEKRKIEDAFKRRVEGYLMTAFGIVAGLAWNEAVKDLMAYLLPMQKDTIFAKFLYAIIMTFILILISLYVIRFINRSDPKKEIESIKG